MGNTEKITGRILDDARREAEAITKEAAVRARTIRDRGAEEGARLLRTAAAEAEAEAEALKTRLESAAQLEARKRILREKQSLVESTFEMARKKLLEMPKDEYTDYLAGLAAAGAVTGREALIFSGKDRAEIGAAVVEAANELRMKRGAVAGLTLSEETRPMTGGLVLSQGDVETNCTVEVLIDSVRDTMGGLIAKQLLQ